MYFIFSAIVLIDGIITNNGWFVLAAAIFAVADSLYHIKRSSNQSVEIL